MQTIAQQIINLIAAGNKIAARKLANDYILNSKN
tara:strand:+ start:354 stop:455 length:102 start_codon:yes stop_codon:yes gene_type:complete